MHPGAHQTSSSSYSLAEESQGDVSLNPDARDLKQSRFQRLTMVCLNLAIANWPEFV